LFLRDRTNRQIARKVQTIDLIIRPTAQLTRAINQKIQTINPRTQKKSLVKQRLGKESARMKSVELRLEKNDIKNS
jgi:hypothetical protein